MSTEENKALVRRGIEALNRGNAMEISPMVDELFVPDFVLHDPNISLPAGGVRNREDYKQFLSGFKAALAGQFTIEDLILLHQHPVSCVQSLELHRGGCHR
jgi:hypothetical protein